MDGSNDCVTMEELSESKALLRRILENPFDDAPRLIYSDILEELGEEERAEFVRVQLQIDQLKQQKTDLYNEETDWQECTSLSANWCPNCGDCCCKNPEDSKSDGDCPLHAPHSKHDCLSQNLDELHRCVDRETRIANHSGEWLTYGIGNKLTYVWNGNGGNGFCVVTSEGVEIVWQRGFISEIRLTCKQFVGGTCKTCGGTGTIGVYVNYDPICRLCSGTGRVEGLAKRLFSEHPVVRVVLTDKEPIDNAGVMEYFGEPSNPPDTWFWLKDTGRSGMRWAIPEALFMFLSKDEFSSEDVALDDLSAACVAHGRSLAGLPSLGAK